jgi:hypothetical protein
MQSVIMLCDMTMNVIILSVIKLSVVMPTVVMLNAECSFAVS